MAGRVRGFIRGNVWIGGGGGGVGCSIGTEKRLGSGSLKSADVGCFTGVGVREVGLEGDFVGDLGLLGCPLGKRG